MTPSPHPVPSRLLAALAMALFAGCGERPPTPAPAPPPAAPADDVKIMTEYWEGTDRIKFRYELRKGSDGRYARNGFSQAFYLSGGVEREGHYRDQERVGVWKYFDPEGKLLRTEDRPDGPQPQTPLTIPPAP
jgi:hypothetical protein